LSSDYRIWAFHPGNRRYQDEMLSILDILQVSQRSFSNLFAATLILQQPTVAEFCEHILINAIFLHMKNLLY
jgi:hypothetical protein